MYNFLNDSIYECNNDSFDYDIYTEKLFNFPFDGLADKICEIRDALPSEFINTSQGKKFIDKYGDDIIKICMILEKEPYELGLQELKAIEAIICSILSSIVLIRAILLDLTVLGIAAGVFTLIFAAIGLIIQSATNGRKYVDASIWITINDIEMYLKKINPKTLPKPTQKKYYDILEAIDKNKSLFNEKRCDNMYDLTDLIFEKYNEGKLSEDKMLLLLEASNVYKEEIKKIKEKIKKKEKLTEAEKKKYEDYKKSRNKKIATGVGVVAAGIATAAAADHIGNKIGERKVSNNYRRELDDGLKEMDISNKGHLDAIDKYPHLYTNKNIDSEIFGQEIYMDAYQKQNEDAKKRIEELSKNKFKNRNEIRDLEYGIDVRRQKIEKVKAQIAELKKRMK